MDYEYEYNRLIKNLDKFRNELFDQKDMVEAMIKNYPENRTLLYEYRAYGYAINLLDIFVHTPLPKVEKLTDADKVVLNDKTQEVAG